jgi:LacI family transcriptional regulator
MNKKQNVSLKDIAKHLNVSTALVSYVLNGKEKEKRVGKEMTKKIRQAAIDMQYQPNQIARSLRMKESKTIGLILADIANPFFGQLARIIENEATKNGYTVIIGSSDEDNKKSTLLIDTLINRQVDGLIVVPAEGSYEQLKNVIEKQIPLVMVDRCLPGLNASFVVLNNYKASYDATQSLLRKGFRKIAHFAYNTDLNHMQERIRGYQEAMSDHGLSDNEHIHRISLMNINNEMENIFDEFLRKKWDFDALFFATNSLSIVALHVLRQKGIDLSDKKGFIGFDGGDVFDLHNPPLSFVRQPLLDMGKESFYILLDQIKGGTLIQQKMLDPILIER